jgi:3-phenylpropionate/cinnamic acid dioxygenase small subunit
VSDHRAAISALVFAYAERVDGGDLEGVAELFAHATYRAALADGTITTFSGRDEVLTCLRGMVRLYDGKPSTKHVTTNLVIDVEGDSDDPRSATCRSYYTVLQARPDLPLQPIVAGRYHDTFVRDGERWRFTDRLIFTDLVGDVSTHLTVNPFA